MEKLDELEFKWGKKKGMGGKRRDVQFYESFTFDGVDYALYDCVYMHKQGEPEPFIGKLVKIWEHADKSKKVKVQWFFRPHEISYYLKDATMLENELFLASGKGHGLANINPLETIAGKCDVICISTDTRNSQPSAETLQMADYVFYRIFDVENCTISDVMGDTVGEVGVKFVFNRRESTGSVNVTSDSGIRCEEGAAIACKEKVKSAGKHSPHDLGNVGTHENRGGILAKERGINNTTMDKRSTVNAKDAGGKVCGEKDTVKEINSSISHVQVGEKVKPARKSVSVDDTISKRVKIDGAVTSSKIKDKNVEEVLTDSRKSLFHLVTADDAVEFDNDHKITKDMDVLTGKHSKIDTSLCKENSEYMNTEDSLCTANNKNLGDNLSDHEGILPASNDVSPKETMNVGSSKTNLLPNETPKTLPCNDFVGSEEATTLFKSSSPTMRGKLTSIPMSKDKLKPGHDVCLASKDKSLAKDSSHVEEMPQKKVKLDDSLKNFENKENTIKKLKEKKHVIETKKPLLETPYDNKGKLKLGKEALKEYHNEKGRKASHDTPFEGNDTRKIGQIFEVTRRPNVEKSNWMKLPWDDRMKTAHDQGKLVLLQNLDPEYTSREVEDIIWHAFRENCTARVVQHTAISNPHSGKAFVIFKTSEAVDKVVKKLNDGCLMLPNKRPLVVCTGFSPKVFEKQTTFVGHLTIDKARRQIQREGKDAVSTSHYSQSNTIEYEMAMAWCLLQSRSDKWWTKLYEQQTKELKKLKDELKCK